MEKKPSGAQNRKRQRVAKEEARRNEEARAAEAGKPSLRHSLGPPPIGNPVAGIAYAHDALLATLDEVLHDGQITAEQRWNLVTNISKALGMTHAKAHVQKKLQELELEDEEQQDADNGLQENPFARRDPEGCGRATQGGSSVRRSVSTAPDEDGGDPP